MLKHADSQLLQGGEWDSPSVMPPECARDVVKVCGGVGEQSVGDEARPLNEHRLLLAGHHDSFRLSRISARLLKEEILTDIEADDHEMLKKEECRQMPSADG